MDLYQACNKSRGPRLLNILLLRYSGTMCGLAFYSSYTVQCSITCTLQWLSYASICIDTICIPTSSPLYTIGGSIATLYSYSNDYYYRAPKTSQYPTPRSKESISPLAISTVCPDSTTLSTNTDTSTCNRRFRPRLYYLTSHPGRWHTAVLIALPHLDHRLLTAQQMHPGISTD